MGHHRQTKPSVKDVSGQSLVVTLPIHPWYGLNLPIVRYACRSDGQRYVDVVAPSSEIRRLPIEWTDCWVSLTDSGQQTPKVTVEKLLSLAQYLSQKLSETDTLENVIRANTARLRTDVVAVGPVPCRNTSKSIEALGCIGAEEAILRGKQP